MGAPWAGMDGEHEKDSLEIARRAVLKKKSRKMVVRNEQYDHAVFAKI